MACAGQFIDKSLAGIIVAPLWLVRGSLGQAWDFCLVRLVVTWRVLVSSLANSVKYKRHVKEV